MKKVLVVAGFLREDNKEMIRSVCAECGYDVSFFDSPEEAAPVIAEGEIIYCDTSPQLLNMPKLEWCHSANAGVDKTVKTGVFDSGDVILTNSSGAYGRAISEHIIMVTLMLMRRMPEYLEITGKKGWRNDLEIRSVAGSNIVIVGTGNLGSLAAKNFKGLGAARVTGLNRSGRSAEGFDATYRISELKDHISDADVLVMCIPETPETRGLLSEDLINCLPRAAYVINVGRGATVDQKALTEALANGRIAGAALDVMYPEPLPADDPLWSLQNCIITPHSSGDTGLPYSVDRTVEIFCENLKRFAAGEELINRVDPSKGY